MAEGNSELLFNRGLSMKKNSAELIKKTIDVWQPLSKKELNEEDAREIIENITGFFSTLKKWDDKEKENSEDEGNCSLRNRDSSNQA